MNRGADAAQWQNPLRDKEDKRLPRIAGQCAMVLFGVGLLALAAYFFAGGPVSRRRVETFAQRQQLTITPANKDQVIRYLATTRRWRVTGFLVGLFASRFVGPQPGEISTGAEYITIFVGWFLGALVAEVGVAHPAQGPVPAASLRPRRPRPSLTTAPGPGPGGNCGRRTTCSGPRPRRS